MENVEKWLRCGRDNLSIFVQVTALSIFWRARPCTAYRVGASLDEREHVRGRRLLFDSNSSLGGERAKFTPVSRRVSRIYARVLPSWT